MVDAPNPRKAEVLGPMEQHRNKIERRRFWPLATILFAIGVLIGMVIPWALGDVPWAG